MPARPIEEQEAEGTVDLKLVNTYKGRQVCGVQKSIRAFTGIYAARRVLWGRRSMGRFGLGECLVEPTMQWRGRARRATRQ